MDLDKTTPLRPPAKDPTKEAPKSQAQVEPTLPVSQGVTKSPAVAKPAAPAAAAKAQPAPTPPPEAAPTPEVAKPETAADAWLTLLAARGVDYLFANGGTDFAPVVEAYAKGQKLGWKLPRVVVVPHENMGVAMAHGYTMITGRPQVRMVHVGVGTANARNGLSTASRQNVPIFLTA